LELSRRNRAMKRTLQEESGKGGEKDEEESDKENNSKGLDSMGEERCLCIYTKNDFPVMHDDKGSPVSHELASKNTYDPAKPGRRVVNENYIA